MRTDKQASRAIATRRPLSRNPQKLGLHEGNVLCSKVGPFHYDWSTSQQPSAQTVDARQGTPIVDKLQQTAAA